MGQNAKNMEKPKNMSEIDVESFIYVFEVEDYESDIIFFILTKSRGGTRIFCC